MTQKSRQRKLRKRLNKENTDDKPRTGLIPLTGVVRRTEGSHSFEAQRDLRQRWERAKGLDSPSSPATPGQPPRA